MPDELLIISKLDDISKHTHTIFHDTTNYNNKSNFCHT